MYSTKQTILILILFQNAIIPSLSLTAGTVTSDYGRISNIANENIHVASALSLSDCIRQCVDFMKTFTEYTFEDCYAYNYDIDRYTCELIHTTAPVNYITSFETRWKTGIKT